MGKIARREDRKGARARAREKPPVINCPAEKFPIEIFLCRARQEKRFERCGTCSFRRDLPKAGFHLFGGKTARRVLPPGDLVHAPRTTRGADS